MSRGRYRSSLSPAEKQRRMASFPFMALLECLGSSSEIFAYVFGQESSLDSSGPKPGSSCSSLQSASGYCPQSVHVS